MGLLDGKKALITGARKGIGRGITLTLANAGADVGVNDIVDNEVSRRAAELISKRGVKGTFHHGDVSTVAGINNKPQTCREAIAPATAVIVTDDGQLRIALRAQSDGPEARCQAPRPAVRIRRGSPGMWAFGPSRAIAPRAQPRRAVQAWQKQGGCCCCCGSVRGGRGGAVGAVMGIPGMPRRAATLWPQPPAASLNLLEPGKVQIQIRIVDRQGNVIEERVIEQTVEETPAVFDDPTN